MSSARRVNKIIAAHQSNGHRVCYAESTEPITVEHASEQWGTTTGLICTENLGHDGDHVDGACCDRLHRFTAEQAGPPNPDRHRTEACKACGKAWPCDTAILADHFTRE